MAKIKTEKEIVNDPQGTPNTSETPVTPEVPAEANEPKAEEVGEVEDVKKDAEEKVEIPDYALNILKRKPEYEYLYVSSTGGVFVQDTPKHLLKNAVLYHNPFFKK